ncbi:FAD:protein FMN transferase [Pseudooceanicola nitratireducens]|uniref:FAD:protein FMN transferase n=1 Tax=Pseudooceanicola nitratireducens TaxID=517719 RepID=UPI00351549B6
MRMTRRRFLTLSAAAVLPGTARAASQSWRGIAFGGEVSITITGRADRIAADLKALILRMRQIEARFTLFDPGSDLRRLNRLGRAPLGPDLNAVLTVAQAVHDATGGMFDPTVQRLWLDLAEGRAPDPGRIGLGQLRREGGDLVLGPGQQLTLNGIAQGFAADQLRDMLRARGYARALVDMGEQAALGGHFRLGIEDPAAGPVGRVSIRNAAVATSSPGAMRIGGRDHILHPRGGAALWSTVTVVAGQAALADAASTAFCLMDVPAMRRARDRLGLHRVLYVDRDGDVRSL